MSDELPEPRVEDSYVEIAGTSHPGYIIGEHWLITAYERICAGECEADVMADYGWVCNTRFKKLERERDEAREIAECLVPEQGCSPFPWEYEDDE